MIIDFLKDAKLYFWNPYIFKFKTNAREFKINFKLYEKKTWDYPNLGITASEGLSVLFKLKGNKHWYNFDSYARREEIYINMNHILNNQNIEYEVLIYGPLLNFLSKLTVEISDQYMAQQIPYKSNKKILTVGGMQSLGIGCTTTGVTFSNILSRTLESEVYNITINNTNYLDKIFNIFQEVDFLPSVDIGILEVDSYNQLDSNVDKYLIEIIEFLKKYCKKIICWYSIQDNKKYKKINLNKILKRYFYSDDVIILDLSFLHYPKFSEICTISPELINDTGNILIYKELKEIVLENNEWSI